MKKLIATLLALPLIAGLSTVLFAGAGEAAHIKDKMQCRHTWKAYKAQYRSEGKTRGAFMRDCRAGTLPAMPQATPQGTPQGTRSQ
jgi:hypothetical protein